MSKRRIYLLPLAGPLLLGALAGCGPGRGSLSGKVTCQGKGPLRLGTVSVLGGDGVIHNGNIKEDGTFEVPGIAAGTVKVAVSCPDPEQAQAKSRKSGE